MTVLSKTPTTTEGEIEVEHLRVLSHVDWVGPIALYLKRQAVESGLCDQARADRLIVALTEAINNGIVHGNLALDSSLKEDGGEAFGEAIRERSADPAYTGRLLDIRVEQSEDACTWIITDEGEGFNVEKALRTLDSDDPEVMLSSGRGLSIMRAFVDDIDWRNGGRQIRLTLYTEAKRDARRGKRFVYTAAVTIQPDHEETRNALARDLSRTGIAMVTTESLPRGLHVTVVLDADLESARAVGGRIARCRHITGDYHDIAVEFDEPLPLPE